MFPRTGLTNTPGPAPVRQTGSDTTERTARDVHGRVGTRPRWVYELRDPVLGCVPCLRGRGCRSTDDRAGSGPVSRGWRSASSGRCRGAAARALAIIIATLGPALTNISIDAVRLIVGGLQLAFGLRLAAQGNLARVGATRHCMMRTRSSPTRSTRPAPLECNTGPLVADWYSFVLVLQGLVMLEGLEVAFIVIVLLGRASGATLQVASVGGNRRHPLLVVALSGVVVRGSASRWCPRTRSSSP